MSPNQFTIISFAIVLLVVYFAVAYWKDMGSKQIPLRWGLSIYFSTLMVGIGIFLSSSAPPSPPPFAPKADMPATACEMRIGRQEFLKLSSVLKQIRTHLPERQVFIVVEPEKVSSCRYAKDLQAVFADARWNPEPTIIDRGKELIERGVWFYGLENDKDAQEFSEALKTPACQEIQYKENENPSVNAWEFYIKD